MDQQKFYITTAIDYVNSNPHLGTAYEKVAADVIARYKNLCGYRTRLLMGNDEHSHNVERRARELGMTPLDYCDMMAEEFEKTWAALNIRYNDFIRTTEARHISTVQDILMKVNEKGDIYKGSYSGWYCMSCERFYRDKELEDGKCPIHGMKPPWIEEENYFFRLSGYRDALRGLIQERPEFVMPETRRNEVLSILEQGLEDVSISRSTTTWGVPLPFDTGHVVYVWVDALINYLSGIGYATDPERFARYWPADLHIIGKDITRFHCIIWPAILMSAGITLPRSVFAHGFVNVEGTKLSKTKGTAVDPMELVEKYGADPLRYYLVREISFGKDGDFSIRRFEERYNSDLANGLGNLVSRVLSMVEKYAGGVVDRPSSMHDGVGMASVAGEVLKNYRESMDSYDLSGATAEVWRLIRAADGYVEENAPWELAKDRNSSEKLHAVLYHLVEALRQIAILAEPVMPEKTAAIWWRLNLPGTINEAGLKDLEEWGGYPSGIRIRKAEPLFPRLP
jgi:methionyl-tRNA synthetase